MQPIQIDVDPYISPHIISIFGLYVFASDFRIHYSLLSGNLRCVLGQYMLRNSAFFFFFNILGNESLSACSFLIIVAAVTRGIVRIELRLSEILERALIMALIDRAIACT